MSLKDCIHAVRQEFIQFIDEVIRNSKESSLACLPEFIKILWFRLPCFPFHPTPTFFKHRRKFDVFLQFNLDFETENMGRYKIVSKYFLNLSGGRDILVKNFQAVTITKKITAWNSDIWPILSHQIFGADKELKKNGFPLYVMKTERG